MSIPQPGGSLDFLKTAGQLLTSILSKKLHLSLVSKTYTSNLLFKIIVFMEQILSVMRYILMFFKLVLAKIVAVIVRHIGIINALLFSTHIHFINDSLEFLVFALQLINELFVGLLFFSILHFISLNHLLQPKYLHLILLYHGSGFYCVLFILSIWFFECFIIKVNFVNYLYSSFYSLCICYKKVGFIKT